MKKLSIREFRDICTLMNIERFIFASDNQTVSLTTNTIKLGLIFNTVLVALNPNAICLKKSDEYVCFERVKYVKMKSQTSALGTTFEIVCGDNLTSENDISYTIIGK